MKYLENIPNTLFPYQNRDMENVIDCLQSNRKISFIAQTSYGKTFSFCTVAKWFIINNDKKVLILCHKEELVEQASKTCISLGLTVEKIVSNSRRLHHVADVYIAMEKTLHNRLVKNPEFIKNVGMVIIDECHLGNFDKHIYNFTDQKILGFTATPIRDNRITYWKCNRCNSVSKELDDCCNMEMEEWSKPFSMSMIYDELVIGASTSELIEFGSVVSDFYFIEESNNMESLKTDSKGEFTEESQNKVYGTDESVFNCLKNYESHCKGKKTIIFNPSAKVNKLIYEQFKEAGYNIKLYDSVNETEMSRKKTVQWFEDNDDAILCNVACFTTGFDSKEVQAIILNRAIGSLSLYLQCIGRGVRASQKIFKDMCIVVDGGGNFERHGKWSSHRDWYDIFNNGIGKDKPKKESPLNVALCEDCGFLYPRGVATCPECGHTPQTREKAPREVGDTILVPLEPIPPPRGEAIARYTISIGQDIHFAFNLLYQEMIRLFYMHGVSREQYINNKNDGRLQKRVCDIVRSAYFVLLKTPELSGGSNRTLAYVQKKCLERLDKFYNLAE